MAETRGTVEAIAAWLVQIIQPVRERLSEGQVVELLAEMGYGPRAGLESEAALLSAGNALAQKAAVLLPRLATLVEEIEAENASGSSTSCRSGSSSSSSSATRRPPRARRRPWNWWASSTAPW
jgi:hypothetical protein